MAPKEKKKQQPRAAHYSSYVQITAILSTRVSPSTLGGLPGMLLTQATAADLGKQQEQAVTGTVIEPLKQYTYAFRQYASNFQLDVKEIVPGKFDPQKAAQLGVPRGPLYGDLQRGQSVTSLTGEDTMGQLERRYGRVEVAHRILNLHAVWVLCEYQKALPDLKFTFLPNTFFYGLNQRQPPQDVLHAFEAVKAAAGLRTLEAFPVQHIAHSTGLKLEGQDGWKVVFSGDTRPCQSVIDAAQQATLLVHEATFEDGMESDALFKKHSTTGEALGVAAAAGVYRTILTHFSSRYPNIPVMKPPQPAAAAASMEEGIGTSAAAPGSDLAAVGNVIVGFDLMSINLADLAWAPKLLP
eukprot:gene10147-10305_t